MKPNIIGNKDRTFRILWVYLVVLYLCLTRSAYSDDATNTSTDLVAFFKQAISAPPDVERYTVSQYSIKSDSILYYAGARAGSNYFLQILSDSNALLNLKKPLFAFGQSQTDAYQVGQNVASHGTGSNILTQMVGISYTMTRQFLNMGMSEIEPETIRWEDNTFTAKIRNGRGRYGELSISNGLPFRLGISVEKASAPYKIVEYTYPNPSATLNGFPLKMVILGGSDAELKPVSEVVFYSVQLAGRPLPNNFFAAAQFTGTNIIYTNIYSNADLYVGNSKGQTVKVHDSVRKNGGYTNSRARALIFLCLVLTTIIPVIFFVLQCKNKQTNKGIK